MGEAKTELEEWILLQQGKHLKLKFWPILDVLENGGSYNWIRRANSFATGKAFKTKILTYFRRTGEWHCQKDPIIVIIISSSLTCHKLTNLNKNCGWSKQNKKS